jgi:hypothetical protein
VSTPRPARASVGVALHTEHGVHELVDADVVAFEHDAHGVDEEGDIVGDEHEHGTVELPRIADRIGRDDADECLVGPTMQTERELGDRRLVGIPESVVVDILVGQLAVEPAEERPQQLVVGPVAPRQLPQPAKDVGHVVVRTHVGSALSSDTASSST